MKFLDLWGYAFRGIGRSFQFGWSWPLGTGYTNMKDANALTTAQEGAWLDPELQSVFIKGVEITKCNLAVLKVANAMGCHDFDPPQGGEPYMADQLYNLFKSNKRFIQKQMNECAFMANWGSLVFGIAPSWKLDEVHGHVVTIAPGPESHSGTWNLSTPLCLNIGARATSFRLKGVEWAFPVKKGPPEFYAWVPSL